MKRLAALVLTCTLLFNLVGYRFAAGYLQAIYDSQLEALLDKHEYDEARLTELKIPVNVAYQTSWTRHYERVDGEITIDGITYKYVKRKYFHDTLYLKCIPHTKKMQLVAARNEYFRSHNDPAPDGSAKSGNSKIISFIKLINEYNEHSFPLVAYARFQARGSFAITQPERIVSLVHIIPEQPPEATRLLFQLC